MELVPGFMDTPLLVWALKRTPGALDRVYFERSLGLNRHWLQVGGPSCGRLCHMPPTHMGLCNTACMHRNKVHPRSAQDGGHGDSDELFASRQYEV